MKEIILIKNGEIALKGLNRSNFEDELMIIPVHGDENQLKNTAKCAKIIKAQTFNLTNGNEIHLTPDGFTSIINQPQPQQWLSFKSDAMAKNASFSIDLVQENQISAQKIEYKKIFSLGGGAIQIPTNKNKPALLNYMRASLERRIKE